MKTCAECGNEFPNWVKIDGKTKSLSARKHCLTCSPYGERNFCGKKASVDGPIKGRRVERLCKTCGNSFSTKYAATECRACIMSVRRAKRKQKAVELLGGGCKICRYNRCLKALDFHHLDREEKEACLARLIDRSWEVFEAELKKCVLLCNRCHSEVHDGLHPEKEQEWLHGGRVGMVDKPDCESDFAVSYPVDHPYE